MKFWRERLRGDCIRQPRRPTGAYRTQDCAPRVSTSAVEPTQRDDIALIPHRLQEREDGHANAHGRTRSPIDQLDLPAVQSVDQRTEHSAGVCAALAHEFRERRRDAIQVIAFGAHVGQLLCRQLRGLAAMGTVLQCQ